MTFKFEGMQCSVIDNKLECPDDLRIILEPLFMIASGPPEDGEPFLNLLTQIFGRDSVTDFEDDEDDLIY